VCPRSFFAQALFVSTRERVVDISRFF